MRGLTATWWRALSRPRIRASDLVGEQLHQQGVVPPSTIGVALGLAHDADGFEADLLVGADGCGVRRRRVDRDAMMAMVVDEMTHDEPHRLGAESTAVQGRIQEQVDLRVAILGLELLVELDQTRDRAIDDDRQPSRSGLISGEALLGGVPPARDLHGRVDATQLTLVAVGEWTKGYAREVRLDRIEGVSWMADTRSMLGGRRLAMPFPGTACKPGFESEDWCAW
jgi:hypothetical protein